MLVLALGLSLRAEAQTADTLLTGAAADVVATFGEAKALAADPAGRLYVVDAGRAALVQLGPSGAVLGVYGGPGVEEGAFAEPSDIDPTNGLVWYVADAGNHRVQVFSRHFLHLASLPVGRGEAARAEEPRYSTRLDAAERVADGRPVAVAVSPSGDLFAADADRGVVVRWDRQRRAAGVLGSYEAGGGALADPVALAATREALYVADAGRRGIVVYDAFGAYVRTLADGRADGVRALALGGSDLWVVLPERLLVYDETGVLRRTWAVELGEPLVDVALAGGKLFLLTPTRLLVVRE